MPRTLSLRPEPGRRVAVVFEYDRLLVAAMRRVPGRRWDPTARHWTIPRTGEALDTLIRLTRGAPVDLEPSLAGLVTAPYVAAHRGTGNGRGPEGDPASPAQSETLRRLSERMVVQRYSPRTRKAYLHHARAFLAFLRVAPEAAGAAHVGEYLQDVASRDKSVSFQRQAISAIRLLFDDMGRPGVMATVHRPRPDRTLPVVLSPAEVRRLLDATPNPTHRLALALLYSGGLRVGEVVALRVWDIDVDRGVIRVRGGKGRKDRETLLSRSALALLRETRPLTNPRAWIFPGARPGRHLTPRSIQKVFARSLERSGVAKAATVHSLRHSFATHLIQSGVSLRHIQELLGHSSSRTTEIYTHLGQGDLLRIPNPLDAEL